MTAPERIWTASTNGKCHVGFDAPSLNYTNEYVRADLAITETQPDPRDEVIARLVDALRDCDGGLGALGVPRDAEPRSTARTSLAAAKAVMK